MSSNRWTSYKLGDIVNDVAMGPFGSNIKTDNFISTGVPVIRGSNLNDGGFDDKYFVYISEEKAQSLKRSLAYPDDLVFTHRGTIGQVGIIPHDKHPKYLVSQSQMRLTVNKDFLAPRFLYYFFKSHIGQYELLKNSSQVGVPAIASPTRSLKEVDINIPSLTIQNHIASILSSLDDKIELNRQTNQTLESIAQALFKEWFVDFNFPGATGEMQESELGKIPHGWKVGTIGNILNFKNGKSSPKRDEHFEYPVYGANGKIGFAETYNSKPKNIVVGSVGSFCGAVYYTLENSFVTENAIIAEGKADDSSMFSFFVLQSLNLNNHKVGSGQPLLNQSILSSLKIILPSYEIIERFEKISLSIFYKITHNERQIQTLIQLRDTLLPKLMKGEIDVFQAQTQTAAYI